jgi:hypothetical protein
VAALGGGKKTAPNLQSEHDPRPEVRRSEGQCRRGSGPSGRWTITAANPASPARGEAPYLPRGSSNNIVNYKFAQNFPQESYP